MKDGNPVCGHIFHKDCIDKWIIKEKQQNNIPSCPECRTIIEENEFPEEIRVQRERQRQEAHQYWTQRHQDFLLTERQRLQAQQQWTQEGRQQYERQRQERQQQQAQQQENERQWTERERQWTQLQRQLEREQRQLPQQQWIEHQRELELLRQHAFEREQERQRRYELGAQQTQAIHDRLRGGPAINIEDLRTIQIIELEQLEQRPVLFMGIVVCINGQMLTKYLNTDREIELQTNNNIRELKEALLRKAPELAEMRGFFCLDNIRRGVYNMASATPRNPSFVIENMYFGTPSNCDNIYELNTGINLTDDEVLINVYNNYQRKIDRYSYIVGDRVANSQNIKKVSIPVGSNNNYFLNDDNPNIPLPFQANADELTANQRIKSTVHSLCWLVVNIRCNTFQNNNTLVTHTLENRIGGRKTRNKNKKTKKSRGSKKTNRRRIK
jgi:hypothetical protein